MENEVLKQLLLGDPDICMLFVSNMDDNNREIVLKEVITQISSNVELFDRLYMIDCIGKMFKLRGNDFSERISLLDIGKSKDKVIQTVYPYIVSFKQQKAISDQNLHNFCFYLLMFRDSYSAIYCVLYNYISQILNSLTIKRVFKEIGPETISLYLEPPMQFYSEVQIDTNLIPDYFKSSINYIHPDLTRILQKRISLMFQFPNQFPFIQNSSHFTCVNTSIVQNTSFFDLCSQSVLECFISGDFEQVLSNLSIFTELIPYFIIMNYSILYSDINSAPKLLSTSYPISVASKMIERFRNDFLFSSVLSQLSDQLITPLDLQKSSFVSFIQHVLSKYKDLFDFENSLFFIINENDSMTDFDFIHSYLSLKSTLCIIQSPQTLTKNIDILSKNLQSIKKNSIRNSIIIDVFSLIFLQNRGSFVATSDSAKQILKILDFYHIDDYITKGYSFFSKLGFWRSSPKFSELFIRDQNQLFEFIKAKQWNSANDLSTSMPYYRRLYVIAYSVYQLVNRGSLFPESDAYKNQIYLEAFLSNSFYISGFELSESLMTIQPLILKRMNSTEDSILNPINDIENWEPSMTACQFIDNQSIDKISYDNIQAFMVSSTKSKSLSSFLEYFSNYVDASQSDSSLLNRINIRKAVVVCLCSFKQKCALSLAFLAKKTLFELMIEYHCINDIPWEILQKYYYDYPNEVLCIGIERFGKTIKEDCIKIPEIIKKFLNNLDQKKEYPENWLRESLINIDDFIYRFDHQKILCDILKIPEEEILEHQYLILQKVDYLATPSQMSQILKIKLRFMGVYQSEKNCFLEEYFDIDSSSAYEYSLNQKIDIEELLVLLRNSKSLVYVIKRFILDHGSKLYLNFTSFGKETQKMVYRFINPESKLLIRDYFRFSESIRSMIKELSYQAMFELLLNDITLFFSFPMSVIKNISIDKWSSLLELNVEERKLCEYRRICRILLTLYPNHPCISDSVLIFCQSKIQKIRVSKGKHEIQALLIVNKIISILSLIPHKLEFYTILLSLRSFIRKMPCTRYKKSYSFTEIPSQIVYDRLLNICCQFDYVKLEKRILERSQQKLTRFYMRRTYDQISIGLINEARITAKEGKDVSKDFYIETFSPSPRFNNEVLFYDTTVPFLQPLCHFSLYPIDTILKISQMKIEDIKRISIDIISPFNTIKNISSQTSPKLDPILSHTLKFFATHYTSTPACLSILVSFFLFSNAYQSLLSIPLLNSKVECFIHSFFLPGICSMKPMELEKYIISQDPQLIITKELWEGLSLYFLRHKMHHGLFYVHQIRNRLEDAAMVVLTLFNEAKSLEEKLCLIGHAKYALTESINCRTKPNHLINPPFQPSNQSLDEIIQISSVVDLQLEICLVCHHNHIEFSDRMNLIASSEAVEPIAAILILRGMKNSRLYTLLGNKYQIDRNKLLQMACYELRKKTINQSFDDLKALKKSDPSFVVDILPFMVRSLSEGRDWYCIPSCIVELEADPRKQALYFLEFDFLAEAYAHIIVHNLVDYVPLLAMKASLLGNSVLVENCSKIM